MEITAKSVPIKVGVFGIFVIKLVLLRFFREEADEFVQIGALNGLFVLGRSIGFIGKSVWLLLSNKRVYGLAKTETRIEWPLDFWPC